MDGALDESGGKPGSKGRSRFSSRRARKRSWPRRIFLLGTFGLVGFSILVVAAYLTRARWLEPRLLEMTASWSAEALGLELQIEGIEGDYVRHLEVRGLRTLSDRETGPFARIDARAIRIDFSLPALLGGVDGFLRTLRVRLEGAEVELDLNRSLEESERDPDQPASWPGAFPRVELEDCRFSVSGDDMGAEVRGLSGSLEPHGEDLALHVLHLASGETTLSHPSFSPEAFPWELRLELSDRDFALDSLVVDGVLVSDSARVDLTEVELQIVPFEMEVALGEGSTLRAAGSFRDGGLSVRGGVERLELVRVADFLPDEMKSLGGVLDLDLHATVDLASPLSSVGRIDARLERPRWEERTLDRIELTARLREDEVLVQRFVGSSSGNLVSLSNCTLPKSAFDPNLQVSPWSSRSFLDLIERVRGAFAVELTDVPALLGEVGREELSESWSPLAHAVSLTGAVREGGVFVEEARIDVPSGTVSLREVSALLPIAGRELAECPVKGSLVVQVGEIGEVCDLFGMNAVRGSFDGEVQVGGFLSDLEARVQLDGKDLVFRNVPLGELTTRATARGDEIKLDFFEVRRGEDRVHLHGALDWRRREFRDGGASVKIADLRAYGINDGEGGEADVLEMSLETLEGRLPTDHLGSFEGRAVATISRFRFRGSPLVRGTVDVSGSPDGIFLEEVELSVQGVRVQAEGAIPVLPLDGSPLSKPLDLRVRIDSDDLQRAQSLLFEESPSLLEEGTLEGTLDLGGTLFYPSGRLEVRADDLRPRSDIPCPPGSLNFSADVTFDRQICRVERCEVLSDGVAFNLGGTVTGVYDWLRSMRSSDALHPPGTIDLKGGIELPRLDWLEEGTGFRRLTGRVISDFSVSGSLTDPNLEGSIEVRDGGLRFSSDLPGVEGLHLEAEFDQRSLSLGSLRGSLGAAPFEVVGGVDWSEDLSDPKFGLRLTGRDLLLFRNDGVKVRADTNLTASGLLSGLRLEGKVELTDCRFVKNVEFLDLFRQRVSSVLQGEQSPPTAARLGFFSFRSEPLRSAVFDLEIDSKEPFQVKNNVARGTLRPDLRLTGTGEVPLLHGQIYIDRTMINLPASSVRIESGVLHFLETDPDRPRLDVVAQERISGYDISMLVQGPIDEPEVILSSIPPLPDEDLVFLVLTGQLPGNRSRSDSSRQAVMSVATYLGRDLLSRFFSDGSTESTESILERFSVAMGRDVTEKGEETIEASFRLVDRILRDDSSLYISGERDRYDDYNVGFRVVFRFR